MTELPERCRTKPKKSETNIGRILRISKVLDPWGKTQANNETTGEGLSPKAILIIKKINSTWGEKKNINNNRGSGGEGKVQSSSTGELECHGGLESRSWRRGSGEEDEAGTAGEFADWNPGTEAGRAKNK